MKRFGILAHSAEGASLCFLTFCREAFGRLGPHLHPDVTLDCSAMAHSMAAWDEGDYQLIRSILSASVERLAAAGCDFFACPDNTAHIALEHPGPDLALPGLNIADVVASEASALGMRRVGLLGTRYTMKGPVYARALTDRGIGFEVPVSEDLREVDRIIFEELVDGRFTEPSRRVYAKVIDRLAEKDCDGVALVCTEIPLLVTPEVSSLPILDSTRLLAQAALKTACGEIALPVWRGGPPLRHGS
ncbi:amino acid racemase [Mesorhizobium sp.]|uniref:aspartate/glutamate racemase family protein n=1 Tax=Mesorhizobium sp. TaxID=1871066 RepID=UPI00121EF3CD|nr:amino acid racemase [Mesorhizobium sp.]TIV59135.1 MAG: amino acid racemase [Mesorhizobium sp.]